MDIFEENCDTENNCTVSYFWKGLALFLLGVIIGLFVFAYQERRYYRL